MIGATIRNTANPTMLEAGYKANVIPSRAEATIDARFLPGQEDALLDDHRRAASATASTREFIVRDIAVETAFDGALVDAMSAALRAEDAGAHPMPYLMSGGTDAKSFSTLGMRCFGFSPLLLPAGSRLHVAVPRHRRAGAGRRRCKFGVRVLDRLLSSCVTLSVGA